MAKRFSVVPTMHGFLTKESQDGALVAYSDYAGLKSENAKLEEALRECVDDMEWFVRRVESGEVKSVKTYLKFKDRAAKAREVLGDA